MPDKDDPQDDSEDLLSEEAPKEFEIKKKHIDKVRMAVKNSGSKIAYKSPIVSKYIGKKLKVDYKKPTSPVKNTDTSKNSVNDIIDMARKGQGNIKMGNKLKNKLKK